MKKYMDEPSDVHTYPTEYYGVAVIEGRNGGGIADFDLLGALILLNREQVEELVSKILRYNYQ